MTANNPFAPHNIEHLSPSTCNLFESSPAAFVLSKLLKRGGSVGAAAHRGTSVESGIVHGLRYNAPDEDCIQIAKDEFWKLTALTNDPRREKESDSIADFVKVGLKELRPYGPPTETQGKIAFSFDEIAVPFTGYFDFVFEGNILIDLKTTHALPSKISEKHSRQVALYVASTGYKHEGRITYVTSKKSATYKLENVAEHVETIKRIGLTIQRFLSLSADPNELASYVIPDVSSFYFNDPEARQACWEIWGV